MFALFTVLTRGQSMLGTVEKILELMDYTPDLDRLTELNRQQIARSDGA
jgi:hypothetical protein